MRYLLLLVFVLSLGACQNPKIETLEAEKAGFVLLYEKEAKKAAEASQTVMEAEANAVLATEDVERAMAMARVAQAEAQEQARLARLIQEELEKCKSGE